MAKPKKEKPAKHSIKEILAVLARKIQIMDEQSKQQRVLIDELEERIMDLEDRADDAKEVVFQDGTGFDWD